jgi:hypothetical protein
VPPGLLLASSRAWVSNWKGLIDDEGFVCALDADGEPVLVAPETALACLATTATAGSCFEMGILFPEYVVGCGID